MAVLMLAMTAWSGAATEYSFFNITENGNTNIGSQLRMFVDAEGSGVSFTFFNLGSVPSVITEIYFDDGTLLAQSSIVNGPGVQYQRGSGNLPGANNATPPFVASQEFGIDPSNPAPTHGINNSPAPADPTDEWVKVVFSLQDNQTLTDTLNAISTGTLRVGMHLQAIGSTGGSDSYINNTSSTNTTPVPLPAAAWMGMALLGSVGGVGYLRRRRRLA